MTTQEYESALKALQLEFDNKKKQLMISCALSNKIYNTGDIITGYSGIIKIDKVSYGKSISELPECIYSGIELKKDLTPMKKESRNSIWQSNVLNKITK